jgi:hypothetical protein
MKEQPSIATLICNIQRPFLKKLSQCNTSEYSFSKFCVWGYLCNLTCLHMLCAMQIYMHVYKMKLICKKILVNISEFGISHQTALKKHHKKSIWI